jgi:hypothetical protein
MSQFGLKTVPNGLPMFASPNRTLRDESNTRRGCECTVYIMRLFGLGKQTLIAKAAQDFVATAAAADRLGPN